ncbi:MAG: type II toxin-antitoxin system VapC family toxin [Pirellulaceae bacterium]|nr:type II toxin-antitoxin system VapC family toxin [Pirellulaceae bacterium]
MVKYVLDTDIISLLQQGHQQTSAHFSQVPTAEVGISVISVEEQLSSWYTLIRQSKKPEDVAWGYYSLAQTVSSFSRFEIISYTVAAIARFEQLKRMKLGVRAPDLRIAAIVLEHSGGILVTRNIWDFRLVPGLAFEDWSKP